MTDNDNWRKVAGNLHQGLTEALRDKQRVLVLIGNAVAAYRRGGGCMSSADYHGDECVCLRCSMQRLEALLTDKKNVGNETRVAELEAANRGLVRLNEATEARAEAAEAKLVKALEPDYCYDDEWEYTMPYDQWPELFDGAEVGTVHALHTLIKGPTFYVVEVPVDTNGDGEPDDWEWRKFNSREEADAFLAEIGEGHE